MAKIVTVTFNPTIDKSTTVRALAPEQKLRGTEPIFEPGGGGINVARVLKRLGGEAVAIYPTGGHTGKFLNELLEQEGILIQPVPVEGHTRENLIVLETSTNNQYRFGMPGAELKEEEWKALLQKIEEEKDVEFIIASGSLSPGVPNDVFARIAALAKKKNARFIADTSGDALKAAAKEGVFLLKPNLAELSSLVGRDNINMEFVDDVAREIINKGFCELIVVSLGPTGAVMVTKDEIYQATPPAVKKVSTVGAGDSMVAGLVYSLANGRSPQEALCYGVAAGTASTMRPGTELCHKDDVEKIYNKTRVQVLAEL